MSEWSHFFKGKPEGKKKYTTSTPTFFSNLSHGVSLAVVSFGWAAVVSGACGAFACSCFNGHPHRDWEGGGAGTRDRHMLRLAILLISKLKDMGRWQSLLALYLCLNIKGLHYIFQRSIIDQTQDFLSNTSHGEQTHKSLTSRQWVSFLLLQVWKHFEEGGGEKEMRIIRVITEDCPCKQQSQMGTNRKQFILVLAVLLHVLLE